MHNLAEAIIYGTVNDVLQAVQQGADVNELDAYGYTPLIETTIVNDIDKANILLQQKVDLSQSDITGRTALHWTTDNHNLAFTEMLLKAGADPNSYTRWGQSVLVMPYLRGQQELKEMLYQYGASLQFAKDFVNAKLLGHRYELVGQVHIVSPSNRFVLMDFEGFFIEISVAIIKSSLKNYKNHFSARGMGVFFRDIDLLLKALQHGEELLRYQHYLIDPHQHQERIDACLSNELLFIPATYQGHAISFISYRDLFIKCDRGANSQFEAPVVIYRVTKPQALTLDFFQYIIYKKHTDEFMHLGINEFLGLETIGEIPMPAQISGNCSWANVEASIPAMLFLLQFARENDVEASLESALEFFHHWREWDEDRSLDTCLDAFTHADDSRKASYAAMLGAALFQCCHYENDKDVMRAEKIISIVGLPKYHYILDSYLNVYCKHQNTVACDNMRHLLDLVKI